MLKVGSFASQVAGAFILVSCVTVGAVSAHPQKKAADRQAADKKAKDASEVVKGETGAVLERFMRSERNFPGGFSGTVLVAKGGEVLLAKGYGLEDAAAKRPMRADALWDWCSVTKQWTAAAILKLEMQKKLAIDWPLTKIYPQAPDDKKKITLRHLMNHTSAISSKASFNGVDLWSRDAFVDFALRLPVEAAPGTRWEYSNIAYFLLAAIVEKVTGGTYEKYVVDNVFKPAGMKDASFIGLPELDLKRVPKEADGTGPQFAYGNKMSWGYRGAGGIVASTRDLLAWHQALKGDKLLSAAAKQKYYTVGLEDYALGWEVKKDGRGLRYAHSGHTGKLVTFYLRDVENDVVVAYVSSDEPKVHPEITCTHLWMIAREGKLPPGAEE
jgi:CubicO group peptidase (beta-lactamase class C family)